VDDGEEILPGTGRGEPDTDPSHAHFNDCRNLEQLQADRARGGLGQFGALQADGTQAFHQQVGEAGQEKPYLIGGEAGARDAGKLRLEGKEYVVADGDVMHFRFNN